MLSDASSLAIAYLSYILGKKSSSRKAEVIGASINSFVLLVAAFFILKEAIEKITIGSMAIMGWPVFIVAFLGLVVNVASYYILMKKAKKDLNIKAAISHMVVDALGSLGVIVAVVFTMIGFPIADAIVAIMISLFVFYISFGLIWDCIKVIKEGQWEKSHVCKKGCCCD